MFMSIITKKNLTSIRFYYQNGFDMVSVNTRRNKKKKETPQQVKAKWLFWFQIHKTA